MLQKKIFFLILILSSSIASAGTTALQDLMFSFGMIQDPHVQTCPEDMPVDTKSSAAQLWAQAEASSGDYNKCKSALFYHSLILTHPESPYYKEAYRAFIETFIKAQDFVMAMNKGNEYLDAHSGADDSEYIHLLVLRAVQGQIRLLNGSTEKQNEFVAYSLGASLEQSEEAPLLLNLKYRSFLDRYPHSIYKDEVLGMMNDSRQAYGQKILQDARSLILKMDYPAAFVKYNVILQWGPTVNVFGEALFEMIKYHLELAWIVSDKALLNDYKLNQFLKRDLQTISSLAERKSLSEKTRAQALKYIEQMKVNLPGSLWTQKAMDLVLDQKRS